MKLRKPITFRTTFATYEASQKIGEGGSGTVFAATDSEGGSFAVKRLDSSKATLERLKRFKNEYLFCSRTTHANIIHVVDHGVSDADAPFIVMPLYEGSLRKVCKGGLEPDAALKIFSKIMNGVEAAHLLQVVHRDLKPENILVRDDANEVVVTDFGIARFLAEDLYTAIDTKENSRLANFLYAAPEQRVRGSDVGLRADIYALGLILNELITGKVPQGTNFTSIGSVNSEFAYLDLIVEQLISQDPDSRPSSIRELRSIFNTNRTQYLEQQKLNELQQRVVPQSKVEEPLAVEPPEIETVDWDRGVLRILLDREVTPDWVRAFMNMNGFQYTQQCAPSRFEFSENRSSAPMPPDNVQQAVDLFKTWLPLATKRLREDISDELASRERQERELIEQEKRHSEVRQQVLKKLKI